MNFGKRLKSLREARNLSQGELAKLSGIKREYLSRYENGRLKNPTLNTMTKLAKGLGFADAAIFLTNDAKVLAAIVSAAAWTAIVGTETETETAKQFRELCALVEKAYDGIVMVGEQLEEMGREK